MALLVVCYQSRGEFGVQLATRVIFFYRMGRDGTVGLVACNGDDCAYSTVLHAMNFLTLFGGDKGSNVIIVSFLGGNVFCSFLK